MRPNQTISESKVFPDMLQVLGKVLVGGTMLLIVNKHQSRDDITLNVRQETGKPYTTAKN